MNSDIKHEMTLISRGSNVGLEHAEARIEMNGELLLRGTRAEGRGLNVVVFDPRKGMVVDKKVFDVWGEESASAAFAAFVEKVRAGDVVAVAVCDDGSRYVTGTSSWHGKKSEAAVAACKALGSTEVDRLEWRDSWALIGRKGGPALKELLSRSGPVTISASVSAAAPSLSDMSMTFHVYEETTHKRLLRSGKLSTIRLEPGILRVGPYLVDEPEIHGDKISFSWQNKDNPGEQLRGELEITRGGILQIRGSIWMGTTKRNTREHKVFGTAVRPVAFKTWISKVPREGVSVEGYKDIPADAWREGPSLLVSYELDGAMHPVPVVNLGGKPVAGKATWEIEADGSIRMKLRDADWDFEDLKSNTASACLAVQRASCTLTGTIAIDGSGTPGTFLLRGSQDSEKEDYVPPYPEVVASDGLALPGMTLSEEHLLSLIPNPVTVVERANELLRRNMLWAMGEDSEQKEYLTTIFGKGPPTLTGPAKASAQKSLAWYQKTLSRAMMTSSFDKYKGPNEPTTRLSEKQRETLQAFLTGGLLQSKDYVEQHRALYLEAFRSLAPAIGSYQDGSERWAKRLFNFLCEPERLTLIIAQVANGLGEAASFTKLNSYASLLDVLAPGSSYAADFHRLVLTGVIVHSFEHVEHKDEALMRPWVPAAVEELLRRAAQGEIFDHSDITKKQTEDALAFYREHAVEVSDAVIRLLQVYTKAGKPAGPQPTSKYAIIAALDGVVARFPRLFFIGRLLPALSWAGAVYSVYATMAHENLSDIPPREVVALVSQSVMLVSQMPDVILLTKRAIDQTRWQITVQETRASLTTYSSLTGVEAQGARIVRTASMSNLSQSVPRSTSGLVDDLDVLVRVNRRLAPLARAARTQPQVNSGFARVFEEGKVVGTLRLFGAAASIAMAVVSWWQFADDLNDPDKSSKVVTVELVMASVNTLATVFVVADLFVASTAIPVIGTVLLVGGLVLAAVAWAIDEPRKPADKYMREIGVPFVETLTVAASVTSGVDGIKKTLAQGQAA